MHCINKIIKFSLFNYLFFYDLLIKFGFYTLEELKWNKNSIKITDT